MYFSLRITPDLFKCPFGLALKIIPALIKQGHADADNYITADEKLNNRGESTTRHFHFNFISDSKKDSLQKYIRRWFADREYNISSPKNSYALSIYNEPDDVDRWYRYCMKEKYIPELTKLSDYTAEQLNGMELCAKDERKTTVSLNKKADAKKAEKLTMYDKLEKYLNEYEKANPLNTFRSITMKIYEFYIQNKHSINVKTIDGYTNLYMLKNNKMTIEEFYDTNH